MLYPAELKAHFSKSPAGSFTGVTKPPASFRIRARLSPDSDPAGGLYLPADALAIFVVVTALQWQTYSTFIPRP